MVMMLWSCTVIGTQICNLVVALKQFLHLSTEENARGNKCSLALTAGGPGALNWRLLHEIPINPNSLFSRSPLLIFLFIKETGLKRISQTKVKSELHFDPMTQTH